MKPLFVYKKKMKPSEELLTELKEAGFICVPVNYFDDVKITVGFDMPSRDSMFLLKSALEAITKDDMHGHAKKALGEKLIAESMRQIQSTK